MKNYYLKHKNIKHFVLILFCFLFKYVYSQNNFESAAEDWKQQTANYIIEGYTTDNPDDYIWSQVENQIQGVIIYVSASEVVPIYVQLDNNIIDFSTRSSDTFAYTFMTHLSISVDNNSYINIYHGTPKQDIVWFNSSDFLPSLGDHNLKINIIDEFGYSYNREYKIKVIPASDALFKDNYGNTLRLWKGDNSKLSPPVVFSEGFDAYDTNPQEMYYYAAQDLINCMNQNGTDVFLLNNRFGTQNIRNNAAGFTSAVKYISALYNNIPIIAGGVSMGGMIARYAFAKAEDDEEPLPACIFISIDSPQQGAVISKPLQDYKKEHQEGDGFAEHALDNDAAKQLLCYNTYDPSGIMHTTFYNELNNLNNDGYPHQTSKNIGVSFSNNQPNPNAGDWLQIEWYIPIPGEETFELTDDEKQPGSYLPLDLTTTDPVVMIASYWWIQLVLPPLQPLYYPTVYFNRIKDPTYIPYKSALDIINGVSKFDIVIEPSLTTHHDKLPIEIIDPILSELVLINKYLQNITIDDNYSVFGSIIKAGNHVTNFIPQGNVIIQNNADVFISASESILIKEGFKVNKGSKLLIKVDNNLNISCDNNKDLNKFSDNYFNNEVSYNSQNIIYDDYKYLLYPNPSKGKYTFESYTEILSYCIFNSTGSIVLRRKLNHKKKKITFNISNQSCGVFFLKVIQTKETKFFKLVKY